jgi:hypothetical protein
MTVQIAEGYFGSVRLDGARFAAIFSFPGAIHEGNGTFQLILDERATAEQRDAIVAITGGTHGGLIFEIFAAVTANRPTPLIMPIAIESDRERRVAKLSLPGLIEFTADAIRNPVTGEEHRAQIRLPNGFEYREAEMGNSTLLKAKAGSIAFEHRDTYAQFNAFDWGNEAA